VLQAFERFNTLASNPVYSDADKQAMLEALETLQILQRNTTRALRLNRDPFSAWALLRENRGDFIKQPQSGDVQIVASGRGAWIGWVELLPETVDATAIRMTGKVIDEVAADILCVVEAESRPALVRMNTTLLAGRYGHVMLVDGNDPRGIDIGLFCDPAIEVTSIRSHVDIPDPATPGHPLFSRDCPVYQLRLPSDADLWLVLNHLKS